MFICTKPLTGAAGVLAMPAATTGAGRRDRTTHAGQRGLVIDSIVFGTAVNEWTAVDVPSSEPVPFGGADG